MSVWALKEFYTPTVPRNKIRELANELSFVFHPGSLHWEDECEQAAKMIEAWVQVEME